MAEPKLYDFTKNKVRIHVLHYHIEDDIVLSFEDVKTGKPILGIQLDREYYNSIVKKIKTIPKKEDD